MCYYFYLLRSFLPHSDYRLGVESKNDLYAKGDINYLSHRTSKIV